VTKYASDVEARNVVPRGPQFRKPMAFSFFVGKYSISASEVTTLWRYTNLLIIIIIFFIFLKPTSTKPQAEKLG